MAYIPVNPERRDPGFFKKKAEIGLQNVDNMSAAEFVNVVAEDIKTLGNKKKLSSKITKKGEFYGGLVKTATKSSHVEFTLGLFDSSNSSKELASIHVDFSFSCTSEDEFGHVNYTIGCTDGDPYLKNLYIVFSQVQDQLYVTLHSPSLPVRSSQVYFNIIGINLLDYTTGVEKLDSSKDISEIVKNHELARIRLTGPSSTMGSGSADSLAVYDENERKVSLDDLSSLDDLDYPSINDVPFIGKKGLLIGNEEKGRHITVPAFHKDSTREGSGVHDWEVLGDIKKINISKSGTEATPKESSKIPNDTDLGYGLVRPSKYKILPPTSVTQDNVISWLDSLGEDTDVITVGAFKEYMSYLIKLYSGVTVDSYHLYLRDSEDLFKYVPSGSYSFTLDIYSFKKKVGGSTAPVDVPIIASSSNDWLTPGNIIKAEGEDFWRIEIDVNPNTSNYERRGVITITQEGTNRSIDINVTQSLFEIRYGILFDENPVFEDSGYSITKWKNEGVKETHKVVPIITDNIDPRGYKEIKNFKELIFSNTNSWISGNLEGDTLSLSVEPNYMSSVRTGTIYIGIIEKNVEKIKYIPIRCSQKSVDSYLYIDDNTEQDSVVLCTVGKEEITKRFYISSNSSWSVSENSVPDWITLSGYSGERPSGSSYLTTIISENNTQSIREAEIKITNKGGIQRTIKITQTSRTVYIDINNQAKDQFFSFGVNDSFDVSSVTVNVNSNVNWFIDQCPSWIVPSVYDGGEQGKATTTKLTLSMPERGEYSNVGEVVSLAYFDESNKIIHALRKITILPSIVGFENSNKYVLPQSPLNIEITSEGGPTTIGAFANVKYKMYFLDETSPFGTESPYVDMLEGYSLNAVYTSENPKSDPTKQTNLTFTVSKNESAHERSFRFILVPEDAEEGTVSEDEYPIFKVTQSGSKSILPFVYNEDTDLEIIKTDELGFWVTYTGETTDVAPPVHPVRNPKYVKRKVYRSFYSSGGKIVVLSGNAKLYRSGSETTVLGEVVTAIVPYLTNNEDSWYIIKESGYYFSTNGESKIITPTYTNYTCDPWKTEFNISLLSVGNNCWDLYNSTLPDWVSLEKISGASSVDSFKVIVDENIKSEDRECDLFFYVDSIERSIKSFTIRQAGFEVIQGESELISITPIISSGKTTFTSSQFEVGLSILARYSSSVTVNGVKHDYHYSEYKYSGIDFSTPDTMEDVRVVNDVFGKPKLVVQENTHQEPRTIRLTASYEGKTGWIELIQGSDTEIKYLTYSDVELEPEFEDKIIPSGISKFGFKIKGKITLNTLSIDTGEITKVSSPNKEEIKLPYQINKFEISEDCGLTLISPDTLEYSGPINGEMKFFFTTTKYTLEDGKLVEISEINETKGILFETGQEEGTVTVGNTLLSGADPGKTLSTKLSFTKFQEINITREDKSTDVGNYIITNIPSSTNGTNYSGPIEITAKLGNKPTEYLNNKIITFRVSDPESKKILKYIHVRYIRSTPIINCELSETSYIYNRINKTGQTLSKIKVSSNIGYNSYPWSNYSEGVVINGGSYNTSEVKLEDTRLIEYRSEGQPSRKWYQKYATESLILRDSDNYGFTKEVPIVLPIGSGSTTGMEIIGSNNNKILSFGDVISEDSYNLYLPFDGGSETFKIKSYEPYSVLERSLVILSNNSNVSGGEYTRRGLTIEDSRNWIQTKVGSLGEMILKLGCDLPNTGTSSVYRGTVVLTSPTRNFTINIYQSSRAGIAKIITPKSKILTVSGLRSSNGINIGESVTFSHLYPGWEIVQMGISLMNHRYPKFNNREYSSVFGNGGNSGSTYTNSDFKTSSVQIKYDDDVLLAIRNQSLELKSLQSCISEESGISVNGLFGIKNATVDILQTSGGTVPTTDTFEVKARPDTPIFGILQKDGDQFVPSDSLQVKKEYYSDPISMTSRLTRSLEFYVSTDLFKRTVPYIGKTLSVNGDSVNITNQRVIFEKLFNKVVLDFAIQTGITSSSSNTGTKTVYKPESYVTDPDTREVYAYFKISNISSSAGDLTGSLTLSVKGFTVDPKYYQASTITLSLPVIE